MKYPFKIKEDKFPLCKASGCSKFSATDAKGRKAKNGLCHKHYQLAWRFNNPLMSYFRSIKDHARKRKIKFSLSYKYFKTIAPENWKELSCDRKEATKGYEPGNIQFIPFRRMLLKGIESVTYLSISST